MCLLLQFNQNPPITGTPFRFTTRGAFLLYKKYIFVILSLIHPICFPFLNPVRDCTSEQLICTNCRNYASTAQDILDFTSIKMKRASSEYVLDGIFSLIERIIFKGKKINFLTCGTYTHHISTARKSPPPKKNRSLLASVGKGINIYARFCFLGWRLPRVTPLLKCHSRYPRV